MWPFKKKASPKAAQNLKDMLDTLNRPNSKRNVADAINYEQSTGDHIGKNIHTKPTGMIQVEQAIYTLTKISSKYVDKKYDNFYSFLSDYARHVVSLFVTNETKDFSGIFEAIELIIKNGTEEVRNAIVTGLLEDIQNISGNNNQDPQQFEQYLFPESKKWWEEINRFWKDLETYQNK